MSKIWAYMVIVIVLVGAVGGAAKLVYDAGKDSMRAEYAEAERKLKKKLNEIKVVAAAKLQAAVNKQLSERRQANAKIQKLYRENQTLRAWWDTPIPIDAVNHAYGLQKQPPATEQLRPRP